MSASDIKFTEPDEVIRKQVVPTAEAAAAQGDSSGDRSPTDEETKRDAPVKLFTEDEPAEETVRKPVVTEDNT